MEAQQWLVEYSDFIKRWRDTPASVSMPGGENLQEVQARAIQTLERITRCYPNDSTLLLSSHNFVNRTLLCYALNVPLDRFREVRQETAALNVLYAQGQQLRAEVVNECSHLESCNGSKTK